MRMPKVLTLLLLMALAASGGAQTRYVTDEFQITMRSGESSSHRILRMLETGTALRVLSTNAETGYSKVVTGDGREGFVLTRQLVDQPVARDRLVALQERLRELEAAPGELSAKLAALQDEHTELQRAHRELQQIKENIESELTSLQRTAANAVRISNERDELRKQVVALTREAEDLKQERRELENSSTQRWFLIGAGVVTGGILIGLILPRLRVRRRRDSWGSL
jgi:SH3 domain protein